MKRYITCLSFLLFLFISSCSDDEIKDSFGYLSVKISQDATNTTTFTKAVRYIQ